MFNIIKIIHNINGDIMSDIIRVIIRAIVSLTTLFFMTKLLGKKQVSQLSLFDYVIGISIGNFAAEMTINLDSHILHGTIAVIIFGLVAYLISFLTIKSIFLRRFFMDKPTVLIANGIIQRKGLLKVKCDINDLLEQCRCQGYFDVNDIEFALMEGNGMLSILPKDRKKIVTKGDMGIKEEKNGLVANVIIDGRIMRDNLINIGKNERWLLSKLKSRNIKDIILATVDVNEKIVIYNKSNNCYKDILE